MAETLNLVKIHMICNSDNLVQQLQDWQLIPTEPTYKCPKCDGPLKLTSDTTKVYITKYNYCEDNCVKDVTPLDTNEVLKSRCEKLEEKRHNVLIDEDIEMQISPLLGPCPEEYIWPRTARIFKRSKLATQSGTFNTHQWVVEFENAIRWDNPLMGWTSVGDPLTSLELHFSDWQQATEFCMKQGYMFEIDFSSCSEYKALRPGSYGSNYSWNKRTRVSTK